ncbi:MAG: MBL fold metallo-hydrolase [Candidatus Rokuibacteriota bacterium]|nr:MAG: MBL fold metallo-hydrolase [Candidatus Rokubacteria bacterium]
METRVDEIAARVYRLSTFVASGAGSPGFTFNQFLVDADEPLLFACGQRSLFASVSAAAARVVSLDRLRWITFSHVESDECGALNDWLTAAPRAVVAHGRLACAIWLNEMADRPPRVLADGEVLDLGGKQVKHIATPHLPHNWEAALCHEETTGTLFCSDLFTQLGECPPTTTADVVAPAIATEERFRFVPVTAETAPAIRRLGALAPRTLALMHGPSFAGEARRPLESLAGYYDERLRRAVAG